jgi:uncharacterized membrane protein
MLQQLDVAIAIVVVLLGVSLFVTILTQMISALFNLRGSHLRAGLVTLLKTADPRLEEHAAAIVMKVITHPLLSDSAFSESSPFTAKQWAEKAMPRIARHWRCASAIRRSELKAVLRHLASDQRNANESWYHALKSALASDFSVVKDTLPSPLASRLHGLADTVVSGVSGVEARIDTWFDSAMNRVSQRFALNVRAWTAALAVLVAFGMHFDAIDLYNKVSADKAMRDELVKLSTSLGADAQSNPQDVNQLAVRARELRERFAVAQVQLSFPTRAGHMQRFAETGTVPGMLGILIGAALLSLGSPFWFNALKGLTSLKTTVASAIDQEKQSATASASGAAAAARV